MDERNIDEVIVEKRNYSTEARKKIMAAWDAYIDAVCKGRSEEEKAALYHIACDLTDNGVQ